MREKNQYSNIFGIPSTVGSGSLITTITKRQLSALAIRFEESDIQAELFAGGRLLKGDDYDYHKKEKSVYATRISGKDKRAADKRTV